MTAVGPGAEALPPALRAKGLDTIDGAFAYQGGEDLVKTHLGTRRRTRVHVTDAEGRTRPLYLKRYGPERWAARLRRRWTYGRWCSPAAVELANIRAARQAGLPTMQEVLFAEEPVSLSRGGRSFLIVTAVPGDALERSLEGFLARHEADDAAARLTRRLADCVRKLHAAGYAHRDLYSSHIFLHEHQGDLELYLIDLARMFSPRWRRFRWRVKDLAQIKHSMPAAWVAGHWEAFLSAYCKGGDRAAIRRYNRAIDRKAAAIRRHSLRKRRRQAAQRPPA